MDDGEEEYDDEKNKDPAFEWNEQHKKKKKKKSISITFNHLSIMNDDNIPKKYKPSEKEFKKFKKKFTISSEYDCIIWHQNKKIKRDVIRFTVNKNQVRVRHMIFSWQNGYECENRIGVKCGNAKCVNPNHFICRGKIVSAVKSKEDTKTIDEPHIGEGGNERKHKIDVEDEEINEKTKKRKKIFSREEIESFIEIIKKNNMNKSVAKKSLSQLSRDTGAGRTVLSKLQNGRTYTSIQCETLDIDLTSSSSSQTQSQSTEDSSSQSKSDTLQNV